MASAIICGGSASRKAVLLLGAVSLALAGLLRCGGGDGVPCSLSSGGKPCDVEGDSCVVGEGNCPELHVCTNHVWTFEYGAPPGGGLPCP